MRPLCFWLFAVDLAAFFTFWLDKRAAIKHRRRVRVSTLLGLSALGGAAGALLAMYLFRHKTRKKLFVIGVPLMLFLQAGLVFWLSRRTLLYR